MVACWSVREMFSFGVIALLSISACQKEAAPVAPHQVPTSKALEAANVAAVEDPEPEVHPCKHCTIDVARRVTGTWQASNCLPGSSGEVIYPVTLPTVEVLAGSQKGKEFPVDVAPASFASGDALSGKVAEDADVNAWQEARLWVKGANGARCGSLLSIQR